MMDALLRWVPLVIGLATLLSAALLPAHAVAQHVVEGRVVSASDGMPIGEATVRAVGENLVVGTDSAGFFRFELPTDRPGVALEVEMIGYRTLNRTWILPLESPIVIGLRQEAVELEGIDVEVDRSRMSPAKRLEYRVRSIPGGIPRTAGAAALRAFGNQNAELLDFFPAMTVATGAGCESCLMANGRFDPDRWLIDDREVLFDEFRSYPVRDICRVDVVTIPVAGSPMEKGVVFAYTCDFLRQVATGQKTLRLLLTNLWGIED